MKRIPELTLKDITRFCSKIDTSSPNGCYEWTAGCGHFGHGNFRIRDRDYIASRVAFKLANPNWDESDNVLHHCDNPRCVNIAHLYNGSKRDNAVDVIERNRGGNQILTYETADLLRQEYLETGASAVTLSEKYGMRPSSVRCVLQNRRFKTPLGEQIRQLRFLRERKITDVAKCRNNYPACG